MPIDVPAMLAGHATTVAAAFDSVLAEQHAAPPRLIEAIRYSLDAGGKRLRPALVLEVFDSVFREPAPPPATPKTIPFPHKPTRPAAHAGEDRAPTSTCRPPPGPSRSRIPATTVRMGAVWRRPAPFPPPGPPF